MPNSFFRFPVWALVCVLASFPSAASAADGSASVKAEQTSAHAGHEAAGKQKRYSVSTSEYAVPADLTLTDHNGETVILSRLLDAQEPLLLQFIFTTCTTICPVMSASFASARDELATVEPGYRMISISIDPEHDTPRILRDYAERYQAGDRWQFLTGSRDAIIETLKGFDAYYPGNNKMYHQPYTYLRARRTGPWLRIKGLPGAAQLAAEYRALLGGDDQQHVHGQ